jgi:hypothetical protein
MMILTSKKEVKLSSISLIVRSGRGYIVWMLFISCSDRFVIERAFKFFLFSSALSV